MRLLKAQITKLALAGTLTLLFASTAVCADQVTSVMTPDVQANVTPAKALTMLRANGMDYDTHPVRQAMRRIGVISVMNRQFVRLKATISKEEAGKALSSSPDWLVIDGKQGPQYLMPAVDLASYLDEAVADEIALLDIPAQRYHLTSIHHQANLQEAAEHLEKTGAEAVYIVQSAVPGIRRIQGILTRGRIESAYRV